MRFTKPYVCPKCPSYYSWYKGNLEKHVSAVHEGQKNYQCQLCKKKFSSKQNLKYHMDRHEGKRDHRCQICDKTFTQQANLKYHLEAVHQGKKGYPCNICQKEFSTKAYLKVHQKLHEEDKKFECSICNKTFLKKRYLNAHVTAVHVVVKPGVSSQQKKSVNYICCDSLAIHHT